MCLALLAGGCETVQVQGRRVRDKDARFSIDLPSRDWRLESAEEVDDARVIVFAHSKRRGRIVLEVTAAPETKAPLDVLLRRLFFGMTDKRFLKREERVIAGQPAAFVEMTGKEEGEEVRIAAYALKVGQQLYDVAYFAPPADFPAGERDFHQLAESFQFATLPPPGQGREQ